MIMNPATAILIALGTRDDITLDQIRSLSALDLARIDIARILHRFYVNGLVLRCGHPFRYALTASGNRWLADVCIESGMVIPTPSRADIDPVFAGMRDSMQQKYGGRRRSRKPAPGWRAIHAAIRDFNRQLAAKQRAARRALLT